MSKKEKKIIIDHMYFDDLVDVFNLGQKLFTSDKWPQLYRTWDEYEIMERYISDNDFCIVARNDSKVIGFAIGAIIEKERSSWLYGYLIWMGVEKRYTGKGVAKRLMNKMIKLFKEEGVKIVLVDTSADNERALAFFRKNGFKNDEGHVFLSRNISKLK